MPRALRNDHDGSPDGCGLQRGSRESAGVGSRGGNCQERGDGIREQRAVRRKMAVERMRGGDSGYRLSVVPRMVMMMRRKQKQQCRIGRKEHERNAPADAGKCADAGMPAVMVHRLI